MQGKMGRRQKKAGVRESDESIDDGRMMMDEWKLFDPFQPPPPYGVLPLYRGRVLGWGIVFPGFRFAAPGAIIVKALRAL